MNTNFRLTQYAILFFLSAQLLISSNVHLLYKGTDVVLIGYAQEQAIPYVLESENIEMACMLSGALAPFILSFSRVTTPPHQLAWKEATGKRTPIGHLGTFWDDPIVGCRYH